MSLQLNTVAKQQLSSPPTSAARGQVILQVLDNIPGGNTVFVPPEGAGDPVLTDDLAKALETVASESKEDGIVRFLTPILREIRGLVGEESDGRGCHRVLVNSEAHTWLKHPDSDELLKPDLFMTWAPFVAARGRGGDGSGADAVGVLAGTALQAAGCVRELYEAKSVPLTAGPFGKLVSYHECITGECFGMLFNQKEFWLYRTFNGHPQRLIRASWTQPGTRALISSFFAAAQEPLLLSALQELCDAFHTAVVVPTGARTPYLGSGAHGHVFAVNDPAKPQALKVVLLNEEVSISQVSGEFEALMRASHSKATVVPAIGKLHPITHGGVVVASGYLLDAVGTPCTLHGRGSTDVFSALLALHDQKIYHGDARLPNLINVGGKLLWIDLRKTLVGGSHLSDTMRLALMRTDAAQLVASCLPATIAALRSTEIAALVATYPDSAPQLAALVQSCLG
jgi:hypothetical protein